MFHSPQWILMATMSFGLTILSSSAASNTVSIFATRLVSVGIHVVDVRPSHPRLPHTDLWWHRWVREITVTDFAPVSQGTDSIYETLGIE